MVAKIADVSLRMLAHGDHRIDALRKALRGDMPFAVRQQKKAPRE